MIEIAAITYATLIGVTILFQLALALGAPWGALAMGGRYPGKLPPAVRVAEVIQAALLSFFAVVVLTRAALMLDDYYETSETAIWFVIGVSVLSFGVNLATPSRWERLIWGPVTGLMLASVLIVQFAPDG